MIDQSLDTSRINSIFSSFGMLLNPVTSIANKGLSPTDYILTIYMFYGAGFIEQVYKLNQRK